MGNFISSPLLDDNENIDLKNQILNIEDSLKAVEKTQMRGYVYGIHETKDGLKEYLDLSHNHIVMNGRKWLMQRAVGGSMDSEIIDNVNPPHSWIINWFGVGDGGANSSDPFKPLYTPDITEDLVSPIKIHNVYSEEFRYSYDGYKKTFRQFNGINAQMKYDDINSEVVALYHLVLDYDDCPYQLPNLGMKISELGLFISPSTNDSETNFILFSRYCMPTKYKSYNDKYTFLWYIYF